MLNPYYWKIHVLCIVYYGFLNIHGDFFYLLLFLYLSSFPFTRALPDDLNHTALLILLVYIDIWKPAAVSSFINVAAGEKERVILNT